MQISNKRSDIRTSMNTAILYTTIPHRNPTTVLKAASYIYRVAQKTSRSLRNYNSACTLSGKNSYCAL